METDPLAVTRTAVVTGATSGIGRALAEGLAGAGLSVATVSRDARRGEEARAAIAVASANDRVRAFTGDLSELSSVRSLGRSLAEAYPAIDVLVHCAAVYTARRSTTPDGLETMFATNLVGPFLLTHLLDDRLRAGGARILVLSAPSTVKLDFDDLQGERRFRSLTAFGASKAADLLWTFELARRLEGSGVTANAVHPGLARTRLMRDAPALMRWFVWLASRSPEHAVASIVPLAAAPEYQGRSGRFYKGGHDIDPPPYTRDPVVASRLWDVLALLAQVGPEASR